MTSSLSRSKAKGKGKALVRQSGSIINLEDIQEKSAGGSRERVNSMGPPTIVPKAKPFVRSPRTDKRQSMSDQFGQHASKTLDEVRTSLVAANITISQRDKVSQDNLALEKQRFEHKCVQDEQDFELKRRETEARVRQAEQDSVHARIRMDEEMKERQGRETRENQRFQLELKESRARQARERAKEAQKVAGDKAERLSRPPCS